MKNKNKIPCKLVGYGNGIKTKSRNVFFDLDLNQMVKIQVFSIIPI